MEKGRTSFHLTFTLELTERTIAHHSRAGFQLMVATGMCRCDHMHIYQQCSLQRGLGLVQALSRHTGAA